MERYFRGEQLIDREENIKFLIDWFEKIPKEILWIYGPKSSGKTTLIEYVVENELFEDFWKLKPKKNYWVKYINLRRYLISSYDSFIEAFLTVKKNTRKKKESINARINTGIFELNAGILKEIKEREKDLFNALIDEIESESKRKKCVIIIDEIQTLEEIYINGDRELLKEFLNFCVSLTKELHLSHVVILSSNTVFIDRIYNDAKLKKTSNFYKIMHLDKSTTEEWLKEEGFSFDEIEMIWEYFGGCISDIQKLMRHWKREEVPLKEYLNHQAWLAYTEIDEFLAIFNDEQESFFKEVGKEILKRSYFSIANLKEYKRRLLKNWAEKEILFYDPLELKVTGNSRIYEKGMEMLLK